MIYFHAKDQYEVNYQLLINERKGVSLKHYEDSKAFIEYSNNMGDIYKNIEEFSLNKECKTLIVFDDMIAHMLRAIKISANSNRIIYQSYKIKHFS